MVTNQPITPTIIAQSAAVAIVMLHHEHVHDMYLLATPLVERNEQSTRLLAYADVASQSSAKEWGRRRILPGSAGANEGSAVVGIAVTVTVLVLHTHDHLAN